ncbi:hypothetical protein [Actinoplanes sp. CA-252034]|uniref:hypothetical protein n=1 Tax=Actinoplanes sp. CA-252034 TaxID=3239906 RepID=UPI003D9766BA
MTGGSGDRAAGARMARRILWTEIRRGTPPLVALFTAMAMTWMLAAHPESWAGQWTGLSTYLRVSLLILIPLQVAGGAWQIGRDRRARIEDLLSTMPRPAWQPLVAAWAAVTLAGLAGLVPPLVIAMILVGLRASHVGDGWWWPLLVGLIALPSAAALGVLLGRFVALRLVAPVAGVIVYLGLAVPVYLHETRWTGLSPVIGYAGPADVWPVGYHAWQAGWLVALGAVLLSLAARLWWTAVVPGALAAALVVAAPAGSGVGTDAAALALVCTDRTPQVCVTRVHAFLLEDIAGPVEAQLARVAGVPGAPVRAVDVLAREQDERRDDVWWISITTQAGVTGGPAHPEWLPDVRELIYDTGCPSPADPTAAQTLTTASEHLAEELTPEHEQWVGRVLAAARACDQDELRRLARS